MSNLTGVGALHLLKNKKMSVFKSQFSSYVGPLRLVYAEDVDSLRTSGRIPHLLSDPRSICLIVSGPPTALENAGLKDNYNWTGSILKEHVGKLMNDPPEHLQELVLNDPLDLEGVVVSSNQRDSILHKITQNLYRIPDKDRRATVQRACFRYLSGQLKRPTPTGLPVLDAVLVSELATTFRECCLATVTAHADITSKRFGVDRFEVGYVIRKVTTDPELLRNIEFPED